MYSSNKDDKSHSFHAINAIFALSKNITNEPSKHLRAIR